MATANFTTKPLVLLKDCLAVSAKDHAHGVRLPSRLFYPKVRWILYGLHCVLTVSALFDPNCLSYMSLEPVGKAIDARLSSSGMPPRNFGFGANGWDSSERPKQ